MSNHDRPRSPDGWRSGAAHRRQGGLYRISLLVAPGTYYGSAYRLGTRKAEHWNDLRKGTHANPLLQQAWNEHGADAFVFDVIAVYDTRTPEARAHLLEVETALLAQVVGTAHCFNLARAARAPMLGRRHSDAARAKMSDASRSRPRPADIGRRISDGMKRAGYRPDAQARANMSTGQRGRRHSPESVERRAAKRRGLTLSAATRAKISAALRGRRWSPERRAAHSGEAHRAAWTAERREAASLRARRRAVSPETRARMSAAARRHHESRRLAARVEPRDGGRRLQPTHRGVSLSGPTASRLRSAARDIV